MATYTDLSQQFTETLATLYDEQEIRNIFRLYAEKKWHIAPYQLYLMMRETIEKRHLETAIADLQRMATGEPIQYILGNGDFYNMELEVNPSVLIPRPETEELVDMVIQENCQRTGMRILDLGTGSGAIAIALALNLPNCHVTATDFSENALATAKVNAQNLHANITFQHADMLHPNYTLLGTHDLIVSNPPYIPLSEKETLHTNVKDHEPEMALFVPNDDPLLFYRAIAEIGKHCLSDGGKLYMETHYRFHKAMTNMMHEYGYENVKSIKDINNRDRFITAELVNR